MAFYWVRTMVSDSSVEYSRPTLPQVRGKEQHDRAEYELSADGHGDEVRSSPFSLQNLSVVIRDPQEHGNQANLEEQSASVVARLQ